VTIFTDLRSAWRAVRAHAALSATIAAILAVAIGANTAVFALVNAVMLSPLPFPDAGRLVTVDQTRPDSAREPLSIPDFRDLRDRTRAFDALAAAFQWSANLTGGEAERLQGMKASATFFTMTGTRAAIGRTIDAADERGAGARVVVLTHALWTRRFGASAGALGTTVVLNGDAYTIVGVLPPSVITPVRDAELIAPFPIDTDPRRSARDAGFLRVLGRLRPDVTVEQARADLDAIMTRLRAENPTTNATHTGTLVVPWRLALSSSQRPVILLLQAAVALVLLIACANVGNLFLASAIRRGHEFAVRAALGASAARRVRQVLLETLLIAACGGAGGLMLHVLIARMLVVLAPADLVALAPPSAAAPRLLAFTAATVLLAAIGFGLLPALQLGRHATVLRTARAASPANRRVRAVLVGTEVAIATLLIVTAMLLARSFARLQHVDPGFSTERLLTARLSLPRSRYPKTVNAARFVDDLRPRLLAIPGVEDAAAVNVVPLNGYHATSDVWPADRPAPPPAERGQAQYRMISPTYIRTFGVPLIAGRSFDEHDNASAEPVVLISRTLARRYWSEAAAIGAQIAVDDHDPPRRARIVGVVGDVKHYGLDAEVTPDVYVPIPQVPDATVQWLANNMYWGIRATGDPSALRDAFRRALRAADPDVPASAVKTMDEALEAALAPRRLNLRLVGAFAAMALALSVAGVYAVTSFGVAMRRREMAIRAALGARVDENVRLVIADAAKPIVAGLLAGLGGALAAAPVLRSVLFDVDPIAAGPFALVAAALLAAGIIASVTAALPIRRIDPLEALRSE
jgi:putative ABC transport system permease protein